MLRLIRQSVKSRRVPPLRGSRDHGDRPAHRRDLRNAIPLRGQKIFPRRWVHGFGNKAGPRSVPVFARITLADRVHCRNPRNAVAIPARLSDDASRPPPRIGLGAVRLRYGAPRQSRARVGVRERSRGGSSRGGRVLAQPPGNGPAIQCGVDPLRARAGRGLRAPQAADARA